MIVETRTLRIHPAPRGRSPRALHAPALRGWPAKASIFPSIADTLAESAAARGRAAAVGAEAAEALRLVAMQADHLRGAIAAIKGCGLAGS